MSSHNFSKNINEQVSEAREAGSVWVSTKGAKDCIICILLVFISQIIDSLQMDSIADQLWSLVTLNYADIIAKNSVVNKVFMGVVISSSGFGLLVLILVLVQTRGYVSLVGFNKIKNRASDSISIELLRSVCVVIFLFLVAKEVLPKACLLVMQSNSKLDFLALFQTVLSRAALFFLFMGVAQIILERRTFLQNLDSTKATD